MQDIASCCVIYGKDERLLNKLKTLIEEQKGYEVESTYQLALLDEDKKEGKKYDIFGRYILKEAIIDESCEIDRLIKKLKEYWGKCELSKEEMLNIIKYMNDNKFVESNLNYLKPTKDGEIAINLFIPLKDVRAILDWVEEIKKYNLEKIENLTEKDLIEIAINFHLFQKEGENRENIIRWIEEEEMEEPPIYNAIDSIRQTLEIMAECYWKKGCNKIGDKCWISSRRVEFGIKSELVPLAILRIPGCGQVKLRTLYDKKIKSWKDIINSDIAELKEILNIDDEEIQENFEKRIKHIKEIENIKDSSKISAILNIPREDVEMFILNK
jgi:hypothetical protein